jgi:hypothetical protein
VIETISRLLKLQHSNGRPVVEIYGNCGVIMEHMKNKSFVFDPSSDEIKGSIVSLNVLRSDGSCVGYNEVSKLAALNAIPIQFRTGCFCNPGGCQDALIKEITLQIRRFVEITLILSTDSLPAQLESVLGKIAYGKISTHLFVS